MNVVRRKIDREQHVHQLSRELADGVYEALLVTEQRRVAISLDNKGYRRAVFGEECVDEPLPEMITQINLHSAPNSTDLFLISSLMNARFFEIRDRTEAKHKKTDIEYKIVNRLCQLPFEFYKPNGSSFSGYDISVAAFFNPINPRNPLFFCLEKEEGSLLMQR